MIQGYKEMEDLTGCIAAIGVSHVVHLEEGPKENKWKRAH